MRLVTTPHNVQIKAWICTGEYQSLFWCPLIRSYLDAHAPKHPSFHQTPLAPKHAFRAALTILLLLRPGVRIDDATDQRNCTVEHPSPSMRWPRHHAIDHSQYRDILLKAQAQTILYYYSESVTKTDYASKGKFSHGGVNLRITKLNLIVTSGVVNATQVH